MVDACYDDRGALFFFFFSEVFLDLGAFKTSAKTDLFGEK